MSNSSLLLSIIALFLVLYAYNIQQRQRAELKLVRSSLESNATLYRQLSKELQKMQDENRRLRSSETTWTNDRGKLTKDIVACTNSTNTCKLSVEKLELQKKNYSQLSRKKDEEKAALQAEIELLKKNIINFENAVPKNETAAVKSKEELPKRQDEIKQLKPSHVVVPLATDSPGESKGDDQLLQGSDVMEKPTRPASTQEKN